MSSNHNRHQWRNLFTFLTLLILPLQCAYTLYKVHPTKFTACRTSHYCAHNALQKVPHVVHHKATPIGKASPHHDYHIAHLHPTTSFKAQLRNSQPLLNIVPHNTQPRSCTTNTITTCPIHKLPCVPSMYPPHTP